MQNYGKNKKKKSTRGGDINRFEGNITKAIKENYEIFKEIEEIEEEKSLSYVDVLHVLNGYNPYKENEEDFLGCYGCNRYTKTFRMLSIQDLPLIKSHAKEIFKDSEEFSKGLIEEFGRETTLLEIKEGTIKNYIKKQVEEFWTTINGASSNPTEMMITRFQNSLESLCSWKVDGYFFGTATAYVEKRIVNEKCKWADKIVKHIYEQLKQDEKTRECAVIEEILRETDGNEKMEKLAENFMEKYGYYQSAEMCLSEIYYEDITDENIKKHYGSNSFNEEEWDGNELYSDMILLMEKINENIIYEESLQLSSETDKMSADMEEKVRPLTEEEKEVLKKEIEEFTRNMMNPEIKVLCSTDDKSIEDILSEQFEKINRLYS